MPLDEATVWEFARRYLQTPSANAAKTLKAEREIEVMVPQVREDGFLTRDQLIHICQWKVGWHKTDAGLNNEGFVREATRIALSAYTEEMRIGALRLLKGVDYSVASVFLHWFHKEPYPIFDRWALAALVGPGPTSDGFADWTAFVDLWRAARLKAGAPDARTFDRALWQWGKEHRVKSAAASPGTLS